MKCHICDNPKVEELEAVLHSDGVTKAYYCKVGFGCRVDAQQNVQSDGAWACAKCGVSNNSSEFNWCYACGKSRPAQQN